MPKKFSLFSVYGIEAEYMIVDKTSLKAKAIADKILYTLNGGAYTNEVELGPISWSNELVNHVLEAKCTEPVTTLDELDTLFHASVLKVNKLLEEHYCILMPTSMHPWFNPLEETVLWPHDQREIYNLYNEIFDCRGHGWSNLQSVHINLPYKDESEFKKLHTAIRAVLPLIPIFAASSPFFEGKPGIYADNRLAFYEKNQAKIPSIIGNIIPENVASTSEYRQILKGIYSDISGYENAKTLQNPWLNSRAAIPKFDVGAIEIRLMDIQESPYMDNCLVQFFVAMIKDIISDEARFSKADKLSDKQLRFIYDEAKKYKPTFNDSIYFDLFGLKGATSAQEFSTSLLKSYITKLPAHYKDGLEVIDQQGNLSTRMTKLGLSVQTYQRLIHSLCLNEALSVS
ncbi:MAG: glutamate--cysteine ligase [Halobacteriovorax sp.]|nr:glutamate--cysteine ligase [Halobacteriovorax sp.]